MSRLQTSMSNSPWVGAPVVSWDEVGVSAIEASLREIFVHAPYWLSESSWQQWLETFMSWSDARTIAEEDLARELVLFFHQWHRSDVLQPAWLFDMVHLDWVCHGLRQRCANEALRSPVTLTQDVMLTPLTLSSRVELLSYQSPMDALSVFVPCRPLSEPSAFSDRCKQQAYALQHIEIGLQLWSLTPREGLLCHMLNDQGAMTGLDLMVSLSKYDRQLKPTQHSTIMQAWLEDAIDHGLLELAN